MLPDELIKTYNYHLPVRRSEMFGNHYDSNARKIQAFTINSNATYLFKLGRNFLYSYNSSPQKLAIHYRDVLLYQAISESLRNLQYANFINNELTAHASYFWEHYSFFDVWNRNIKYPLGTLASFYEGEGGIAQEIIETALTNLWNLYNINETLPKKKVNSSIEDLPYVDYESLNQVLSSHLDNQYARRNLIGKYDIQNLKIKLIRGEYPKELIQFVKAVWTNTGDINCRKWLDCINHIMMKYKAYSFLIIYQALCVEGFIKAANYIQNRPELFLTPIDEFCKIAENEFFNYLILAASCFDIVNNTNSVYKTISMCYRYEKEINTGYLINVD